MTRRTTLANRNRNTTLERAARFGVEADAMNAVRLDDRMVAMTSDELDKLLDRLERAIAQSTGRRNARRR